VPRRETQAACAETCRPVLTCAQASVEDATTQRGAPGCALSRRDAVPSHLQRLQSYVQEPLAHGRDSNAARVRGLLNRLAKDVVERLCLAVLPLAWTVEFASPPRSVFNLPQLGNRGITYEIV